MDEKLKKEKEELKIALESISSGSNNAAVELLKKDMEQQLLTKTKKWEEKRKK